MSEKKEPVGTVHVVDACGRRSNKHAVFAMVMCEDEAGNAWHFEVSCFNFDLKPGHPIYTTTPSTSSAEPT